MPVGCFTRESIPRARNPPKEFESITAQQAAPLCLALAAEDGEEADGQDGADGEKRKAKKSRRAQAQTTEV